jgi:outer membrane protein
MKRLISVVLLLTGLAFCLSAQQSITRFAVVDMNKVIAVIAGQTEGTKEFNEKSARVQAQIEKLNGELQELNAKLEAAREEERPRDVKTLENQVAAKTKAIQDYIKNSFADLERDRAKLVQDDAFLTRLNSILRIVAESEGYSMVLSKQEGSGILWYSPSVDITNKVIERIRSGNTRR